ncbi:sortase, partial [Patescibacteria group bacterium]|nr:sortase [Patescibacteria group bacterium]
MVVVAQFIARCRSSVIYTTIFITQKKSKLIIASLSVFVFLLLFTLFTFWLTQPSTVYERYEQVAEALSVKDGVDLSQPEQIPVSDDFSLLIPKISINVPVIPNVDGGNLSEYLWSVTQGVAHFKHKEFANITVDGAFPGEGGNIFLFGHSQIPGGDTGDYKGVFNSLPKLINGDSIKVVYQGAHYEYVVSEGKVVSKKALEYLEPTGEEVLTLMTCWPLG